MRVFVTGGTGALGRHLVPGLVAAGHQVTASTRLAARTGPLRAPSRSCSTGWTGRR